VDTRNGIGQEKGTKECHRARRKIGNVGKKFAYGPTQDESQKPEDCYTSDETKPTHLYTTLLTPLQYFRLCTVKRHEALRRSTTGGRICGMQPKMLQYTASPPVPYQNRRYCKEEHPSDLHRLGSGTSATVIVTYFVLCVCRPVIRHAGYDTFPGRLWEDCEW